MDLRQRQRMIERHRHSLTRFGYSPEALFWESCEVQNERFKVLSEIGIAAGDSVLDIGCGFGDLYRWLKGHKHSVKYTGIDLSQDILNKGIEVNPELNLLQGEIFDFDWPDQSFDWLLLSGTLNWDLNDDGDYAQRVIRRMFELARKGVAFNMLDSRTLDTTTIRELYASDPAKILTLCKKLTPHCELRDHYLDHDFTIYMRYEL